MPITQNELKDSLLEYRKAYRAMLRFYDSAWSLNELFHSQLSLEFDTVEEPDLSSEIDEEWEKPPGVTFDAFSELTTAAFNWVLRCYSDGYKAAKNSIFLQVELFLDYWSGENDPEDSISAIGVYAYRVTSVNGRANDNWDDIDDNFDDSLFANNKINEDGAPKSHMLLTKFPDVWSSKGKYKGDYAAGLYDLSELIDEKTVKDTVIADIKQLLRDWES